MKKHLSLFCVLSLLIVTILLCLPVSAASVNLVDDRDGLLDADEVAALEIAAREASEGNLQFRLIFAYANQPFSDDYVADNYWESGKNPVILLVYRDAGSVYHYNLYTYGDAYDRITDAEVDRILDADDVYNNLKGGRLQAGSEAFLSLAKKAYDGKLHPPVGKIVAVSSVIGLITAFIVCLVVVLKYKMKIRPTNYPLEHYTNMQLTRSNDIFLGKSVVTRRVSSDNNSGGRSGGSSSGGGSRGGR